MSDPLPVSRRVVIQSIMASAAFPFMPAVAAEELPVGLKGPWGFPVGTYVYSDVQLLPLPAGATVRRFP